MKNYSVYQIINKINEKKYIGATSKGRKRWKTHLKIANAGPKKEKDFSLIHKAINKYGSDNFTFKIIKQFDTKEEMFEAEKFYIAQYKTNIYKYGNEFGYNLTDGGDGVIGYQHTDEQKHTISKRMKNLFAGTNNPFFGKTHSKESRKLISDSRKKNKNNPKYFGENNSQSILTKLEVENIIDLYQKEMLSTSEIAEKLGINVPNIKSIIRGKTWKEISQAKALTARTKKEGNNLYFDKKYGKMQIIIKFCPICLNEFQIYVREFAQKGRKKKFCSVKCRLIAQANSSSQGYSSSSSSSSSQSISSQDEQSQLEHSSSSSSS